MVINPNNHETLIGIDPEVLALLTDWRTEEARRQGMPPYVIFPDRTLVALAAAQPRSQEALLQVRGVGPAKLEAYGERLLHLLGSGAPAEVEKSLPNQ